MGQTRCLESNNLVTYHTLSVEKYLRKEMRYEKVTSCRSSFTHQHLWQLRGNMEG
jgi:hypothetical protein